MAAYEPALASAPLSGKMLDDLVRDSLRPLLPITTLLIWVWASVALLTAEGKELYALGVLVLTLGVAISSYLLHQRHLSLAVGLYVGGLMASVTLIAVAFHTTSSLYLYIPVLLVTAMLTSPPVTWGMASASVGLILVVGRTVLGASWGELASPLVYISLAALTSWLSSRRLFMALGWALSMTQEAQKKAEEARQRRAEARSILKSLEEACVRLERANQALIFAREAAEKAYRFKAEFVANVSHELRTPLNLIVGFSEMMALSPESYRAQPLPSAYRGDIMAIYRGARHLTELINDVLDLSQIEAGRLPLERELADLGEIIRESADMVRGLAQGKGLRLELELPESLPPLHLDRTRLRQVLLNLLTNAARFTDKGWIRVRAQEGAQEVKVWVEDSGRGIAADRIARAFEAFSQLHEDQAREGSGLGLAVSRKFVELHGGTMAIESTLGHGTTVSFALPLPESEQDAPSALVRTSPVQGNYESPQVLVWHEDRQALALLQRHIDGYQFVAAATKQQAVEALQGGSIRAVVIDSNSAESWQELTRELAPAARLPTLACPLPSLRRVGQRLGAADFMAKPVTREALVEALGRLPHPTKKLLIVDDDLSLVRLLTRMIETLPAPIELLEAANGREGLAALRAGRPDAVLLDLVMPEMDGRAFLAEVRRDPALAATPVIVMSAHAEQDRAQLEGALSLRYCDGFSVTEVVQAVQALLGLVTLPAPETPASA